VTLEEVRRDRQLRWAVERAFQVAAEALFDTGTHILAAEFQESVDEYREIPTRLHARGVIAAATADRLQGLAGFRNVLVHDYAEVDPVRVVAGMERLADFDAFVADVEGLPRSSIDVIEREQPIPTPRPSDLVAAKSPPVA
jgi:uncharacterized protein YutE (UPF0331/DUF86 family)